MMGYPDISETTIRGGLQLIFLLLNSMKGGRNKLKKKKAFSFPCGS